MSETPTQFLDAVRALRATFPETPSKYVLPLTRNTLGDAEIAAALEVMVRGNVTLGPNVLAFERAFAERHGAADAVFCNSGSSANLLACAALNEDPRPLAPGDEIVVPAVTWSTSVWPIAQVGAVPVLADVSPETLNVTVESVERALSPKTRAVLLVHLLGNPAPVAQIKKLCDERNLVLIEDTCESMDALVGGKRTGTFGRFGTFSFYFSHHISTMEGGMVVCENADDGDTLRALRGHGWTRQMRVATRRAYEAKHTDVDPRFLFVRAGYNLRPTEVAGAIGLVQLARAAEFVAHRKRTAALWSEARAALPKLFSPMRIDDGSSHFALPLVLAPGAPARSALFAFFDAHGVETRPMVAGNLARQPAMARVKHRIAGPLTGADILHERGGYIGIHPLPLSDHELALLPQLMRDFAKKHDLA